MAGNDLQVRKALSGELSVPDDMPPTFIWHTFEDKSVDCRNSLELGMALKQKEIPFEMHIFQSGSHGLDFAKGIAGTEKWFDLFLIWAKVQKFFI